MRENLRVRIAQMLLKKGQFLLASVLPVGEGDFACSTILSSRNEILSASVEKVMNEHAEIRDFLLNCALTYLKRRQVATNEFIRQLNED